MQPVKTGLIGCGNISGIYIRNAKQLEALELTACADLVAKRAAAAAAEHGTARACSVDDLLADDEIELVLNLTVPKAHAAVNLRAMESGKSVYVEKPLAVDRSDGRRALERASELGVRLGGAPDTFMGAALQTCRKLIDEGAIGEPVGATAFMMCRGHESWHPDPEFYYQAGGGPMFDMGPYYLTALIHLLGPVRRVCGSARASFSERTITSEAKRGSRIAVETPTHVAGVMDFAGGAVGTIVMSFDVCSHTMPPIQVYGAEGTLYVPDPNGFGGAVGLQRRGGEIEDVPHTHGYAENSRGIGAADLACGLRSGRAHRAAGELAYHVLDVMQAFLDASESSEYVEVASTCERPAALPTGLEPGRLDP